MPKIFAVLGDLHCNFKWAVRCLQTCLNNGISTIVQLGDFGYWPRTEAGQNYINDLSDILTKNGMTLYWLGGNHEDYASIEGHFGDHENWRTANGFVQVARSLYYIPDGFVWDSWGRTIGALGGGTSIDEAQRQRGWDYFPQEIVSRSSAESMLEEDLDLLLTHVCGGSILAHRYVESNFRLSRRIQDKLMEDENIVGLVRYKTTPTIHCHGHDHHQHSFRNNDNTMVYGLDCDGSLDGNLAVIDLADMRFYRLKVERLKI